MQSHLKASDQIKSLKMM